jgi:hypothetical protein
MPGSLVKNLLVKSWGVLLACSKLNRMAVASNMIKLTEMTVQPLKGA